MAVFKKLDVIKPQDSELVTIYQNVDCATGSIAINDEFHDMLISINGQLKGPLGPGRYALDPRYSPFFTGIRNFPTGGKSPINVTIFYISKQNHTQQWGTGEIVCSEKILKIPLPIRVAAGGTMIFKVSDSKFFLKSLVGLRGFNIEDTSASTRALIIPLIRDAISSRMSSENFVNAQTNLSGVSSLTAGALATSLRDFGLELSKFAVTCFNVNQDDLAKIQQIHEKRLAAATDIEAKANEMAAIYNGNVYDMAKVEALLNFSKNQGTMGNISQLAMFPMMMSIGRQMSEQMGDAFNPDARTPHPAEKLCTHCNQSYPGNYSFCPYCGHQNI